MECGVLNRFIHLVLLTEPCHVPSTSTNERTRQPCDKRITTYLRNDWWVVDGGNKLCCLYFDVEFMSNLSRLAFP